MKKLNHVYVFTINLVIYEFVINMSNDMYLPALPRLEKDFLISPQLAQRTISIWLFGSAISQFFFGILIEYFGKKNTLLTSGYIFLLSTLICFLSKTIEFFFAGRFLQGIAVCGMMVAGYASIHELFEEKKAVKILSWMGSAASLAPMIGPLLGSLILTYFSWKIIFLALFICAFFPLMGIWIKMPISKKTSQISSLNFQFLLKSYYQVFKNLDFLYSSISAGLLLGGLMMWITICPFLLEDIFNISTSYLGWIQIPIFSSYIAGTICVRRWIDQKGIEWLIHQGIFISLCSVIILFILSVFIPNNHFPFLLFLIVGMMGYSFGFGLSCSSLNRITFNSFKEQEGIVSASFYFCLEGLACAGSFSVSLLYNKTLISIFTPLICFIIVAKILNTLRKNRKVTV